ncbi:MAG: histidine phosphatase family protein [Methyloligellaceae bacterium]
MNSDQANEKIIYLIRHGQSEGNAAPVFQSIESPLNETGKKQAQHVAERMSRTPFETLISSPQERAKQTAEYIATATEKTIEFNDLFVERIKPTSINGKPYTDEKANAMWRQWEESMFTPGLRAEDGENYDDIILRADKALNFLCQRTEKSIAVVTHGFILRTIVARIMLEDKISGDLFRQFNKKFSTENTGITILQYRTAFEQPLSWHLGVYNDHSHLG